MKNVFTFLLIPSLGFGLLGGCSQERRPTPVPHRTKERRQTQRYQDVQEKNLKRQQQQFAYEQQKAIEDLAHQQRQEERQQQIQRSPIQDTPDPLLSLDREQYMKEQAKRQRDLQEQLRREAAEVDQVKKESIKTFREEEMRRQMASIERALEESKKSFVEEQKRRELAAQIPVTQSPATPAVLQSETSRWSPQDEHLRQAGEYIMDLRRAKGSNPSHSEISQYLQDKMQLNAPQVRVILDELMVD
jgi:hypothetical protein